jgi:hypothetical protein
MGKVFPRKFFNSSAVSRRANEIPITEAQTKNEMTPLMDFLGGI